MNAEQTAREIEEEEERLRELEKEKGRLTADKAKKGKKNKKGSASSKKGKKDEELTPSPAIGIYTFMLFFITQVDVLLKAEKFQLLRL